MMTYDQHNFVVTVSNQCESLVARMREVFDIKLTLARYFLDNDYKFAIVGEDIVSNEMRINNRFNLIVSVIPKSEGPIAVIDEGHSLKTAMANAIGERGYRYIIADEDMMSDFAKKKIQYLPKEGGEWYEV